MPQELSAKSSFPAALAARGEALQVGPSSVGLRCRRCSTFNFLGLPFPQKERQVLIPHQLHSTSCPKQNVDSELWISRMKIVLTPKKSKIPCLEKPSIGHRARSNIY